MKTFSKQFLIYAIGIKTILAQLNCKDARSIYQMNGCCDAAPGANIAISPTCNNVELGTVSLGGSELKKVVNNFNTDFSSPITSLTTADPVSELQKAQRLLGDAREFLFREADSSKTSDDQGIKDPRSDGSFKYFTDEERLALTIKAEQLATKLDFLDKSALPNVERTVVEYNIERLRAFTLWYKAEGSYPNFVTQVPWNPVDHKYLPYMTKWAHSFAFDYIWEGEDGVSTRLYNMQVTSVDSGKKYLNLAKSAAAAAKSFLSEFYIGVTEKGYRSHTAIYHTLDFYGPGRTSPYNWTRTNYFQDWDHEFKYMYWDYEYLNWDPSYAQTMYDTTLPFDAGLAVEIKNALDDFVNVRKKIIWFYRDPESPFQKSLITDTDQPGMWSIHPDDNKGEAMYELMVAQTTSYHPTDPVFSARQINTSKGDMDYSSFAEVLDNFEFFMDDDPFTRSVQKIHGAGLVTSEMYKGFIGTAAKELVAEMTTAQKTAYQNAGYDLTKRFDVARIVFNDPEYAFKSDRQVIGRDWGYDGLIENGAVKKTDEWNGDMLKFVSTNTFDYAYSEHYHNQPGNYTAWMNGDLEVKLGFLIGCPHAGGCAPEGLNSDLTTYFKQWWENYILGYEKKIRRDILPSMLTAADLQIYDRTHGPIIFKGGDYSGGYGSARYDVANNATVYKIDTMNPLLMIKGYLVSFLVCHELGLGHGLGDVIRQAYAEASKERFSLLGDEHSEGGGYWYEDWAVYMEFLGIELGLYNKITGYEADGTVILHPTEKDYRQIVGGLADASRSNARMVCDTGLNSKHYKWTTAKTFEYFESVTAYPIADVVGLACRFFAVPGQGLSYGPMSIMIFGLRKRAESLLGSNFNLPEFLNVFLSGVPQPAPATAFRNTVEAWITSKL